MDTTSTRRPDRGTSLIEILVAIVLTGTVVIAVVNAVHAVVQTSGYSFMAAKTSTVLLNASDLVNRADQRCDYEVYVDAAAIAEGWETDQISATVERLGANTGSASDWEAEDCLDSVEAFDVQRITITATSPGGEVTKTLTVVKSDVS